MMKKILLTILCISSIGYLGNATLANTNKFENRKGEVKMSENNVNLKEFQEIKDKLELQELVYTFSTLSDTKDVDKQVLLFTEDAVVQSERNGVLTGSKFTGRKEIGDAFKAYLALFETVYHINGQQTVEINGDRATGINYCQVVLVKNENGKKIATTSGIRYSDEYRKINGKWYISNRKSNFMWTKTEEVQ